MRLSPFIRNSSCSLRSSSVSIVSDTHAYPDGPPTHRGGVIPDAIEKLLRELLRLRTIRVGAMRASSSPLNRASMSESCSLGCRSPVKLTRSASPGP